jgi:hypothetical protein
MAPADSDQPVTVTAWVESSGSLCWICGGQNGTGTGFSQSALIYLLSFLFHQCSVFMFVLIQLLLKGQVGKAWEPPNKAYLGV